MSTSRTFKPLLRLATSLPLLHAHARAVGAHPAAAQNGSRASARARGDAADYLFVDAHGRGRKFTVTLAAGYAYAGLLAGEMSCGPGDEAVSQKLVFFYAGGLQAVLERQAASVPLTRTSER